MSLEAAYLWLDLVIAFGGPVALLLLCARGVLPGVVRPLFALGAALGLCWEVPIFTLSALGSTPLITGLGEMPVGWPVFMIGHSLWDGLLFLAGLALVVLLRPAPHLTHLCWQDLAILVGWGQVSALAVELSGIWAGGWAYVPGHWWNPTLFWTRGEPITLFIQVVWLVASVVYLPLANHLVRRARQLPAR